MPSPHRKPLTLEAVLGGAAEGPGIPLAADGSPSVDRRAALELLGRLPCAFEVSGEGPGITPQQALTAPLRNESVYLVRKGALAYGLQHMAADNAQGEQYLTDAIGAILAARTDEGRRFRAGYVATSSAHDVMSYNDPEELLRITDYFHGRRQQSLSELRERLGASTCRTVQQWLELFPADEPLRPEVVQALAANYGEDPELLRERHQAYRAALLRFRQEFGDSRFAIIVRSPGRINIMGRHIDYQGGRCNLMAVNQEVMMVVSPRDDDRIEMRNVRADLFPDASISLGRLVSQLNWDDWLSCISCVELERHLRESAGRWSIYIEAAMLRMQMAFRDRLLQGLDVVAHGNIPVAAGMSSSSALVVSTAEAAAALHGLEVTPSQFVNFCGEGEWFVGTRGGSADHAAMKYGAKGTINHVKFHEFELLEQIPFPDTHRMVVCNSFMQAKKAAGARIAFNSRVASYALGVELVRMRFPQYAALIRYVRDIDGETLHVPPEKIYEILLALPESMTAEQVRRTFGTHDVVAVTGAAFRPGGRRARLSGARRHVVRHRGMCAGARGGPVPQAARHGGARRADEDLPRRRTVLPRAGRPGGDPVRHRYLGRPSARPDRRPAQLGRAPCGSGSAASTAGCLSLQHSGDRRAGGHRVPHPGRAGCPDRRRRARRLCHGAGRVRCGQRVDCDACASNSIRRWDWNPASTCVLPRPAAACCGSTRDVGCVRFPEAREPR